LPRRARLPPSKAVRPVRARAGAATLQSIARRSFAPARMAIVQALQPDPPQEPTMILRLIPRLFALGLSAVLTLAMFGSIDHLAQRDESPAQWAQKTSHRA
jgi:hypothetical protein